MNTSYTYRLLSAMLYLLSFLLLFLLATQAFAGDDKNLSPVGTDQKIEEATLLEQVIQTAPERSIQVKLKFYDAQDNLIGEFSEEDMYFPKDPKAQELLNQSDLLLKTTSTAIFKVNS